MGNYKINPYTDKIDLVLDSQEQDIYDARYLKLDGESTDVTNGTFDLTTTGTVYFIGAITTATDTYTILVSDQTVICNKATAFTVTLPTAVVGQKFTIKNINTGSVTVDGAGSDTIDGQANVVLSQWDSVQLQCYAANKWGIL